MLLIQARASIQLVTKLFQKRHILQQKPVIKHVILVNLRKVRVIARRQ